MYNSFSLSNSFNLWWSYRFSEKSNLYKSPHIEEALKLIALSYILEQDNLNYVDIQIPEVISKRIIDAWIVSKTVSYFDILHKIRNYVASKVLTTLSQLFSIFKAIIWFISYLYNRYRPFIASTSSWTSSSAKFTFINYLCNIDESKYPEFSSSYWGNCQAYFLTWG